MIAGHSRIQLAIERDDLPQVSLFLGPKSVGKRRLANEYARENTNSPRDLFRINRLTAELAREVGHFLHTAPAGTLWRIAIINIDATPITNLNTLLKSLEEMPRFSQAILLASSPPIETIRSRAGVVHEFSLLSEEEVATALIRRGINKADAQMRAAESGGQVKDVLYREEIVKLKSQVLIVARCFREHDNAALDGLASRWTDEHTTLLVKLAHEALTGRWRVFNDAEVGTISPRIWLAILRALKPDVRPRLVVHAQLAGVLKGMS